MNPTTITLAPTSIELAAANVATQAATIANMPCTTVAEDTALAAALAPSSEAGRTLKAIDNARLEIARPVNAALDNLMAYTRTLSAPLSEAIEQGKAKRLAFAKEQAANAAKAEQERRRKLQLLQGMEATMQTFWQEQTIKASQLNLEQLRIAKQSATMWVIKVPDLYKELATEYIATQEAGRAKMLAYFDDLILAAETPNSPQAIAPVVQVSTVAAQMQVLTDVAPQEVQKGVTKTVTLTVNDWRKVDAVAWLSAMFRANPDSATLVEQLNKLAVRFTPKGAEVQGITWKEEIKITNRV